MEEIKLTHIERIEIKGLWGKYDIKWTLDPSVNIITGVNGCGKSTILNLIETLLLEEVPLDGFDPEFLSLVKIGFNGNKFLLQDGKLYDDNYNTFLYDELLSVSKISTFDAVRKFNFKKQPTQEVKTELDFELMMVVEEFNSYLQKLGEKEKKETAILEQKIKEITQKNKLTDEEFKCIGKYYNEIEQFRSRIYKKRNLLYIILNELFETNNKSIEYNGHTAFIVKDGNRNLKIYDLSAGEKQILLILLKVSVFHSQPMVLLLDTPELALHALWQANLVDMINKLNPNCQIIIATHSPNVFGKRWRNKVVNMKDITTLLVS